MSEICVVPQGSLSKASKVMKLSLLMEARSGLRLHSVNIRIHCGVIVNKSDSHLSEPGLIPVIDIFFLHISALFVAGTQT